MGTTVATSKRARILGGTITVAGTRESATIERDPLLVGRDQKCDLVIEDPRVSAVHAEFVATDLGVRVRDLGSRNGTWVGDTRVVESYLTADADLWIGEAELAFEPSKPQRVPVAQADTFGPLYGTSSSMRSLFQRMAKVAPTDLSVLILGETGTGKELIASALHQASKRKKGPFVVVDCGAIPPSLAEAALFGHERGAFTGAVDKKVGPFVEASGGTLFLDELGELPIDVQPKLLRALAERRVKALGSNRYEDVDVRVIAATRRDLRKAVNAGEFRSDLFFRVAQLTLDVPRLRSRVEDIPGLAARMLSEAGGRKAQRRITSETVERLMRHDWPGNVRELKNAVTVAYAMSDDTGPIDVAAYVGQAGDRISALPSAGVDVRFRDAKQEVLERFEKEYFTALADQTQGNVSEMSRISGLERAHVRRYLRRHSIDRKKR